CANAGVERYGQASAEGKRRPPESPSSTKHPRRWRCPIAFLWLRSVGFRTGQSIKIDGGVIVWYITSVSWASRGKSDHRRMRGAPRRVRLPRNGGAKEWQYGKAYVWSADGRVRRGGHRAHARRSPE